MELNDWLSQVKRAYKNEIEDELLEMYQKDTAKYSKMFHEAVLREWDTYMKSYTPKVYQRTGMTRAGIVLDENPDILPNGTVVAKVEFVDAFMYNIDSRTGSERHVFLAMNDGWGTVGKGEPFYRYAGFEGIHILEQVESQIKSILPDYVKLEVVRNGE